DSTIIITSEINDGTLKISLLSDKELKHKVQFKSWSKPGNRFKVRKQTLPWYKGSYKKKIQDGKDGQYVWLKVIVDGEDKFTHLANYRPAHEVWDLGPEHPESPIHLEKESNQ